MKLLQQIALAAVALSFPGYSTSQGVPSNNPQYNYMGLVAASGTYKNDYYEFSYSPPSATYASSKWEHYEGKNSKRSTILLTGLSGYDSYALNVEYKGAVAPQTTPVQAANQQYKTLDFSLYGGNATCASTSLDRPVVISQTIVGLVAFCIDRSTNSLFEVSITWRSLSLPIASFDQVFQESEACRYEKTLAPQVKCSDRIGTLVSAYNQLLSSFRFPGQSLAGLPAQALQHPQAKIYRSADNSFSAQYPAAPLVVPGRQNGAASDDYRVTTARYALSVLVTSRTGNASSTPDNSGTLVANVATARAALSGSSAVEESPVITGRYTGRQLIGVADGHRLHIKIFVTSFHVFTVFATYAPSDEVAELVGNAFMDSFEITE